MRTARVLPALTFATLFSLSVALGRAIEFGGVGTGLSETFMRPLTYTDALVAVLLILVVTLCILAFARFTDRASTGVVDSSPSDTTSWNGTLTSAAVLLFAWSPYLLSYYPGAVVADTLFSLSQGAGVWSNHHPIVFTLVLKAFAGLGGMLGNISTGLYLFTWLQASLLALTLALVVDRMRRLGAGRLVRFAALGYFAFVPVFPIYALALQKDTLFAVVLTLLSLTLLDVANTGAEWFSEGRNIARLAILCLFTLLLRNNGIYVVLIVWSSLWTAYGRAPIRLHQALAALLVAGFAFQWVLLPMLGVLNDAPVESLGVPLQQLGYVVAVDGEATQAQADFLDETLPLEEWSAAYSPTTVDPVKWHPRFGLPNSSLGEFFSTWSGVGLRNPGRYAKAYLLQTQGFWKIGAKSSYGMADTYVRANEYGVQERDLIATLSGHSVRPVLERLRGAGGLDAYIGSGTLFWLIALAATLLLAKRRSAYLLALAPTLGLWITTMVATPVAFSLRYVFALAIVLPLAMFLATTQQNPHGGT